MRLKKQILVGGICLVFFYFGSYAILFSSRIPAANIGYFVYLHGGVKAENEERTLYYLYYPIYKVHRLFGIGRHNLDRPNTATEGLYDGDEPTNSVSR